MILRRLLLAGITVGICWLSACHGNPGQPPVFLTLTYNADGTCSQAPSAVTAISNGQAARWVTANAVPFSVQFAANRSPFSSNNFSSSGAPVTSQPSKGASGTTYDYSNVTINGQSCNLQKLRLGLIMK